MEPLFSTLDSDGIAQLIRVARQSVCYAGPGIQIEPAMAMTQVAHRIGPEMITVSVDFNERVMRMGYGAIAAVKCLRDANIDVSNVPGLRTALVIVDGQGFIFTPTALYLEAEPHGNVAPNAMRLSPSKWRKHWQGYPRLQRPLQLHRRRPQTSGTESPPCRLRLVQRQLPHRSSLRWMFD